MKKSVFSFTYLSMFLTPAWAQPTGNSFPLDTDHITSLSQVENIDSGLLGAADESTRSLIPVALNMVKDFEKWVPYPYNDASKYCTIGYGHLVALKPCENIPSLLVSYPRPFPISEGVRLLDKDTLHVRVSVNNLVTSDLTDEQYGAVVSFVFNVGEGNFSKSTLLKLLNNGEFEAASLQFGRWISSKGVVLNGLINRRACETALFKGDLPSREHGAFVRDDCQSAGAAPDSAIIVDIELGEAVE